MKDLEVIRRKITIIFPTSGTMQVTKLTKPYFYTKLVFHTKTYKKCKNYPFSGCSHRVYLGDEKCKNAFYSKGFFKRVVFWMTLDSNNIVIGSISHDFITSFVLICSFIFLNSKQAFILYFLLFIGLQVFNTSFVVLKNSCTSKISI